MLWATTSPPPASRANPTEVWTTTSATTAKPHAIAPTPRLVPGQALTRFAHTGSPRGQPHHAPAEDGDGRQIPRRADGPGHGEGHGRPHRTRREPVAPTTTPGRRRSRPRPGASLRSPRRRPTPSDTCRASGPGTDRPAGPTHGRWSGRRPRLVDVCQLCAAADHASVWPWLGGSAGPGHPWRPEQQHRDAGRHDDKGGDGDARGDRFLPSGRRAQRRRPDERHDQHGGRPPPEVTGRRRHHDDTDQHTHASGHQATSQRRAGTKQAPAASASKLQWLCVPMSAGHQEAQRDPNERSAQVETQAQDQRYRRGVRRPPRGG